MSDKKQSLSCILTDDEFSKWEGRLIDILLLHQSRHKSNGDAEIEWRKKESERFGSLCLDEKDLLGEEWCEYPYNSKSRSAISVSSFGRVRCEGKIVPQKDQAGKIGYLILDDEKLDKELLKYEVYKIVAATFLNKKEGDGFHTHHITNNGYDNSVGNLICLKDEHHNKIHDTVNSRLKR